MASRPASAAVILSAGASRRFGGRPKALLPVGREVAIARLARICAEAGLERTVAVVGPHRAAIAPALAGGAVEIVPNERWEAGRTGSLQAGLDAVGDVDELLVWPVDHPFADGATIDTLRAAARGDPLAIWFLPTFRGGGGHPILLRSPAFEHVRALAPSAPLRSLLAPLGPQVRRVPVGDAGVLENVDSPDAYEAALEAWRQRSGEGEPWTAA